MLKPGSALALAFFCVAIAYPHSEAHPQSLKDRLGGLKRPEVPAPSQLTGTDNAAPDPAADPLTDPNAADQAASDCVAAGQEDSAAGIKLLSGGGKGDAGLSSETQQFLVGLCIPKDFESQYKLNDYLLTRGGLHSVYAEHNLGSLKAYLDEAGVETGIKVEALQNDDKIGAAFAASSNLDKAALLLTQNQKLAESAAAFIPALESLQAEQKAIALPLAGKARQHALSASYFLARGVRVSQAMSTAMAGQVKSNASSLGSRLGGLRGGDPASTLSEGAAVAQDARDVANETVVAFTEFMKKNGKAVVTTLKNAANVVKSFNTDAAEIPKLTPAEMKADEQSLSAELMLPAALENEETFAASNTPPDGG